MVLAAQAAAIHESIESFDQKYDTLIGERGVTLSGGQRQRTAIARAILKEAPILILDDALSAVDTSTELSILDQVRQQRGKRTVIIIAHRLSTLMHADQIAVMDKGRIVQLGTHDELVARDGLYRRLWQIQGALADDLRRNRLTRHTARRRRRRRRNDPMTAHAMEEEVFTGKMDFALWRKMLPFALPHKRKIFALMTLGAVVSLFDVALRVDDRSDRRCGDRATEPAVRSWQVHRGICWRDRRVSSPAS